MESRRRNQRFSRLMDLGLIGRKTVLPMNPGADHRGVQNPGHVAGFCYDGIPGFVFNFLGRRRDHWFSGLLDQGLIRRKTDLLINPRAINSKESRIVVTLSTCVITDPGIPGGKGGGGGGGGQRRVWKFF